MKSSTPKVLHKLLGKPLLKWVTDSVLSCGIKQPVLIVGHQKEQVRRAMGEDFAYVIQEKQMGTGHAIMCAASLIEQSNQNTVLVLSGDTPLISPETIKDFSAFHQKNNNGVTVLSFIKEDPYGYGRIVRDQNGDLLKIVEQRDALEQEKKITELNSGIYCFDRDCLLSALKKITNLNDQKEYYLTDSIALIKESGYAAGAFTISDPSELAGVNDREQLYDMEKAVKEKIARNLLKAGVWIEDIASTFISPDAQIEPDCEILAGSTIKGKCVIKSGCIIGPHTVLEDVTVLSNTKINASQCYQSKIGSGCNIGPYVHIRPDCDIGNNLRIGNFVEVKNSKVGNNTKISHLTYIGDCDAGENINFGCGTVIVNYDGKVKNRTTIGSNVFVGCNANLIAPVTIHDHSYIAAGSTVTDDVPSGALAIARGKQVNKEGWVYKREGESK